MSKFNDRSSQPAHSPDSPISTGSTPATSTHEGAPAYVRNAKSELFVFAVSNMVGEHTFYEAAGDRDQRFRELIHEVTCYDPSWMVQFITWLRGEANMRSASVVAAAEMAYAELLIRRLSAVSYGDPGLSVSDDIDHHARGAVRLAIDAALQRPDEPGEFLAYWLTRYGKPIPKPVKRGLGDAMRRHGTQQNWLKYDTASHHVRWADVLELAHVKPRDPVQAALFKYAIDRRHNRYDIDIRLLNVIRNNRHIYNTVAAGDTDILLVTLKLHNAGMTWEDTLSLAGNRVPKATLWEALVPEMGYMALLRNLRNLEQAGVSDEVTERVAAKLADPDQVMRSKQFPFRFLAAYNAVASLRWSWALEQALNASLANVPALPGRTLVLVDRSGSMFSRMSARSELINADAAALFGTALTLRAADADLVEFGTNHRLVRVQPGASVLSVVRNQFGCLGGTNTAEAVRANYRQHDRVVIITDEQAHGGYYGADPTGMVPAHVPVYTWNLVGYQQAHGPSGSGNRHTFAGLTDAAFKMIPLLERGKDATWPWKH